MAPALAIALVLRADATTTAPAVTTTAILTNTAAITSPILANDQRPSNPTETIISVTATNPDAPEPTAKPTSPSESPPSDSPSSTSINTNIGSPSRRPYRSWNIYPPERYLPGSGNIPSPYAVQKPEGDDEKRWRMLMMCVGPITLLFCFLYVIGFKVGGKLFGELL